MQSVWDDPISNDGRWFDIEVYPSDLLHDPNRYVMCIDPCPTPAQANEEPVVIIPIDAGVFEGSDGSRRVRVQAACSWIASGVGMNLQLVEKRTHPRGR